MNMTKRNYVNSNSNQLDDIVNMVASSITKIFIIKLDSFENIGQFNEFVSSCKKTIPDANIIIDNGQNDEIEDDGVYVKISKQ